MGQQVEMNYIMMIMFVMLLKGWVDKDRLVLIWIQIWIKGFQIDLVRLKCILLRKIDYFFVVFFVIIIFDWGIRINLLWYNNAI